MIADDAMAVVAGGSDGMTVASLDGDVAVGSMSPINTVGITALRLDGAASGVDVDGAHAVMPGIDAVGQGAYLVGENSRAFRCDVEIPDVDHDIAAVPLMGDFKAGRGVRPARIIVADKAGGAVGRDGAASNVDDDVAGLPGLIPGSDAGSSLRTHGRDVALFNENVDVAVALIHIGIDASGAIALRGDVGIHHVDIDAAVVILAVSPHAVGTAACRGDAASIHFDHDIRGARVCTSVDAEAIRALRLDADVQHDDFDIAGASATPQAKDAVAVGALGHDGGVAHPHFDQAVASIVFDVDAARVAFCRLYGRPRNPNVDAAGSRWRWIRGGWVTGPVPQIGMETMGALTRRGDMRVLSAERDVATAFMTAINAGGVIAHRVDVIAHKILVFIEFGLEVNEDSSGAFMMAGNAGGRVFRRIDVHALGRETDARAGSRGFAAFDPLAFSRSVAANGGLLRRQVNCAESQNGGKGQSRFRSLRTQRLQPEARFFHVRMIGSGF